MFTQKLSQNGVEENNQLKSYLKSQAKSQSQERMDVSENSGTPKSPILIGFSIVNHPFWGTPIFGNTQLIISV